MKWVFVPVLIILTCLQTFTQWAIVLEFRLNRDYIAKTLCINKDRPAMKCGGHCQLMKRLAAEEKQNLPNESSYIGKIKLPLLWNEQHTLHFIPAPFLLQFTLPSRYIIASYTSPVFSIFHPPA
jgi:hypothetical protein